MLIIVFVVAPIPVQSTMWVHDNSRVLKNVSNNFVINLVINYGVILGCIGGICMYGSFPLFYYKFGTSAIEFQKNVAIAFLPWPVCKAIMGAVSDTTPIANYHKRWYLVMASIVLFCALLGVGFATNAFDAVICLIVASSAAATNNTLWEGQYANMVSFLKADPRGIAFSWGMYMAGLAIGACVVGPLGDKSGDDIHKAFFVAAPLALIPIPWLIFLPDSTLPGDRADTMLDHGLLAEDAIHVPKPKLRPKPNRKEWGLVTWIASSSILLMIILLFGAHQSAKAAVGLCAFIVAVSCFAVYYTYIESKVFVAACIMSMCHQLFYWNLQGAYDSFYTANSQCFYDGPNFDLVFYYSVIQILSSVVGMMATTAYASTISRVDIRSAFIGAIVFRIVTGFFDVVIFKRWNTGYLHIGDKAFYIMGDAIAGEAATILVMLPLKTLASKIMPRGKATTAFAILDSFQFLGISISRIIGIVATDAMGVHASKTGGCDFTMLVPLSIMGHQVFPILSLCLAWYMLPRVIIKSE